MLVYSIWSCTCAGSGTLMWWWTALLPVPTTVRSPFAEEIFTQHRPPLWCEQGGYPGVQGRLAIRCRVIGLFVQSKAGWIRFWPVDRGALREAWVQNLSVLPEPHSVLDKGLSVGALMLLPLAVSVCPFRPCREIGLCSRMLAMRGMKSLRVDGPWCVVIPSPSWLKSESKQRSCFRGNIPWEFSSRDVGESLRSRLYLVRFSIPVEDEKESVRIKSAALLFSLYWLSDLPGRSPVCDFNLDKVCSLIIRKQSKGERWNKCKIKKETWKFRSPLRKFN